MPVAAGTLVFDPASEGVAKRPWMAVLRCDEDWHRMAVAELHLRGPRRWVRVVDADRVFTDVHPNRVDLTPRLGVVCAPFVGGRSRRPTVCVEILTARLRS